MEDDAINGGAGFGENKIHDAAGGVCSSLLLPPPPPPPPGSIFSNRSQRQQPMRRGPASHMAMPLSMRLIKSVSGLCCIDCSAKTKGDDFEDHPDLKMLLNYDLQALQCAPLGTSKRPSSASLLVLAPMTMQVVSEEPPTEEINEDDIVFDDEDDEDDGSGGGGYSSSIDNNNKNNNNTNTPANMNRCVVIEHNTSTVSASSFSNLDQEQQVVQQVATSTRSNTQQQRQQQHDEPSTLLRRHRALSTPQHRSTVETIVSEYIAACRFYGCGDRLNAGVMTTLRFSLPCMRVVGHFHDADMLALAEVLFKYMNGPLSFIRRLDFSLSGKQALPRWAGHSAYNGMRSHGALTLAKVLQISKHIEEVFLTRNRIGPYGASAIFIACSTNTSIKKLNLRRCRVCQRGALVFAELVVPSTITALQEVDLSANYIGVKGSMAIDQALLERQQQQKQDAADSSTTNKMPLHAMEVNLEGNHVFQEVMNAVTHGLGILLAIAGTVAMTSRVNGSDFRHKLSCAVYSTSLIVLYTSSTLYHSFFSMQHTKYIFEVLDKCAIYILIAGSYTPFLQIVLGHQPRWSIGLLAFIWICCFLGIAVEFLYPTWQHKGMFSLSMYLGMGWSCLVCLPEVAMLVPESCIKLMILGGVGYTSGIPFFVRNNNLDHAVWHIFVLIGSAFHWCGIYFYIIDFTLAPPTDQVDAMTQNYT